MYTTLHSQHLLDSVLEQAGQCTGSIVWPSLLVCMWFCLFNRWGYKDFQEARNNCGLLQSCGRMCTAKQQTIFLTL